MLMEGNMERVVYLLGAGFSAPLGLPVMANFLTRSRELADNEPEKYGFFNDIFKTIRDMAFAKNFYNADLFNIEEILSILDMQDTVADTDHAKHFAKYIKAVIEACTPDFEPPAPPRRGMPAMSSRARDVGFGDVRPTDLGYLCFVATLVNLRFDRHYDRSSDPPKERLVYSTADSPETQYGIVTLNYDRVIENCVDYVKKHYEMDSVQSEAGVRLPRIAKLHGSVDTEIVPPTWRKLAVSGLEDQWKSAYDMLREATQLRILGYSLPVTDVYVRYLLEAGAMEAEQLKRIDVVCLDDAHGSLRKRYEELVCFRNFRFANRDIADYLDPAETASLHFEKDSPGPPHMLRWEYATLHRRHEAFMTDAKE